MMLRSSQLSKTSLKNSSVQGSNRTQDAPLDIPAHGFWDPQSLAFFDVRVCHPNAESYRDQEPQQISRIHENNKKRLYSRRVLDVEHGSFTPLVFTTTGGMGKECIRYHSGLAKLIAAKKGEHYSQTISWIHARASFALLRSSLVCLRGSRVKRRTAFDYNNYKLNYYKLIVTFTLKKFNLYTWRYLFQGYKISHFFELEDHGKGVPLQLKFYMSK